MDDNSFCIDTWPDRMRQFVHRQFVSHWRLHFSSTTLQTMMMSHLKRHLMNCLLSQNLEVELALQLLKCPHGCAVRHFVRLKLKCHFEGVRLTNGRVFCGSEALVFVKRGGIEWKSICWRFYRSSPRVLDAFWTTLPENKIKPCFLNLNFPGMTLLLGILEIRRFSKILLVWLGNFRNFILIINLGSFKFWAKEHI